MRCHVTILPSFHVGLNIDESFSILKGKGKKVRSSEYIVKKKVKVKGNISFLGVYWCSNCD